MLRKSSVSNHARNREPRCESSTKKNNLDGQPRGSGTPQLWVRGCVCLSDVPTIERTHRAQGRDTGQLPAMTSSSSMSFSPSLKSSSMFSICVPDFLRWELHHAVNVCVNRNRRHVVIIKSPFVCCFPPAFNNKPEWKKRKCNGREGRLERLW